MQKATFAAGCFWGVEAAFRQASGVATTAVGYMGGAVASPTYEEVCTGTTGHVEVVQLEYDPSEVTYDELLNLFWSIHDPTTVDRQGPDQGSQYRSAIFFHDAEQQAAALAFRQRLELSGTYQQPIVTEIIPASPFYRAEEYHQQYLGKKARSRCKS